MRTINFSQIPTNCLLLFLCRLNNDLKNEIAHKTKGLATHIKLVNSIRYSDLEILDKLPANNAKTTNAINAPQSQLACDELVSKQLPSTDHNKRIACDVHESAALILSTLAASDTRSEAETETETEARAANTNANDKQSNAQESIESCDKQCEVEPAPRLVATETCIEEVAVEEEQPAPCASVKEVRAYCLEEILQISSFYHAIQYTLHTYEYMHKYVVTSTLYANFSIITQLLSMFRCCTRTARRQKTARQRRTWR